MGESVKRNLGGRQELESALKAREQFLEDHPELQVFQDEIDRILGQAGGPEDQMMALALLIGEKLRDLYDSMVDLYFSQMKFGKVIAPSANLALEDSLRPSGYLN